MTEVEQIEYEGWSGCYRMSNTIIDLVVTADVGPRIIRLGFLDETNLFCGVEADRGQTGGDEWRMYGGHRFWHAPEAMPRTYVPDNTPVDVEKHEAFLRVIQPTEAATGIQKEIDIYLSDDTAHVRVIHRLRNHNLWTVELAPWALSVMAPGGTGVLPLPPRGTHEDNLLPTNTLTMWAYTDMADPRWTWGERYILLRQDPDAITPQKIGADVRDGWGAYVLDGQCFVKLFEKQMDGLYPDLGCTAEMFTNDFMLELESLGPLIRLAPGGSVEYTEDWFLFQDVSTPTDDNSVAQSLLPLVHKAKAAVKTI